MTTGTVEQDVLAAGGLDFEENGLVATITLNRPETRNSQTPATWHALRIIGSSLSPDVRVVLVRGAGDTFSSGLDRRMLTPDGVDGEHGVMRMLDMPDPEMAESIATWQEGFTWLRRPDIVTVAVVRGAAVGAGFQLALACDLRVLAEDARFSHAGADAGAGPGPDGNKTARRPCWLLAGPGDLRHHPVGRRPTRRARSGWRRPSCPPTSWTTRSPTWSGR